MFEEFDRVIREEQSKFNTMVTETLNKQHKEFCAELDKFVCDSIEESYKQTENMLRESAFFSEENIAQMMSDIRKER